MIRRPPISTLSSSSAASDVYKRQPTCCTGGRAPPVDRCARLSLPTSPGWKDSWVHASRTSGRDVLSTKIELVFDYVGALNDEQRAAVTHQGGSLRVLAG